MDEKRESSTTKNKKFSFWEWLVIVAGIILIIGFLIPGIPRPPVRAKITKAEADIAAIRLAIAMYKEDTGIYPENSHSDWTSIDVLSWRLTGKQPNASIPDSDITGDSKWHGPYIKSITKDSWREYYCYTNNKANVDGTNKQVGVPTGDKVPILPYYIYSKGKDKLTGLGHNADDITSWDEKKLWRDSY